MIEQLLVRRDSGVLVLSLNRVDKKNALNSAMYEALIAQLNEAVSNTDIKAVVLEGQGECFTSGNDLKDFMAVAAQGLSASSTLRFLECYRAFPKPIVVAVKGLAVGIGTTLLLHSDLVYAEADATFSMPFVQLGLCPEFASSYLLPQLAGHAKAFEWLVLGEPFSATEALRAGLINAVVEHASQVALDKAQALAKLPPQAVLTAKSLLKKPRHESVSEVMRDEIQQFAQALRGAEFTEAAAAFFAKRPPKV